MKNQNVTLNLNAVRHYLPLVSTFGWILGFTIGHIPFFEMLSILLIAIGTIAALTVCPLKLLGIPVKWAVVGFKFCRGFIPVYGVADLCAAIFGLGGGMLLGLCVSFGVPGLFTIRKWRKANEEIPQAV